MAEKSREHLKKNPYRLRFGRLVAKQRLERGYESAYGFFHKNGAAKYFGFTYPHYLQIEKGLRVPGKRGLAALLPVLLGPGVPHMQKELVTLYVKAQLDWDPIFECVFAPPEAVSAGQESAGRRDDLLKMLLQQRISSAPRMSMEQFEVIASSTGTLWVYHWLHNTGYEQTAPQLAARLALPLSAIGEALDRLTKSGLLEKKNNGTFFSPCFESDLFDPPKVSREQYLWLSEQYLKRAKEKGNALFHAYFHLPIATPLEGQPELESVRSFLREAMMKAYAYRPKKPVENAVLVGVESRILLLVPPTAE